MCTRLCNRKPRADAPALAAIVLALFPLAALALTSDRDKPANIEADSFRTVQGSEGGNGRNVTVYKGDVVFSQGSIKGHGVDATVYQVSSASQAGSGRIDRVVLTGDPAHIEQMQDDGTLITGNADKIDYKLNANTVELTGHVKLVQRGRGEFNGPHMTYNTTTGVIESGGSGGRIHMTMQPKPSAAPKSETTPADSGQPAPAGEMP